MPVLKITTGEGNDIEIGFDSSSVVDVKGPAGDATVTNVSAIELVDEPTEKPAEPAPAEPPAEEPAKS